MKSSKFLKLAFARSRGAGIAAAALAACGAALAPMGAHAAGYNFVTHNNPASLTFTNLLGINNSDLIAGFYGSGAAGDPNKGFLLTLPNTFTPENFPPSALNPAVQTQMTGLNDTGTMVGYFYNTNLGVAFDNQFGFYVKGGKFFEVNNPQTPTSPPSGILIENQLIGVNNKDLAVGFYNSVGMDAMGPHAVSHGYTYDITTGKFSANIDDPSASTTNGGTVAAAINNSDEIAGFFTDSSGVQHGFIDNGGVFSTVDPAGATQTQLLGLNDKGIADGFAVIGGVQHGILFNSLTDTFTMLDPMGSTATTLNGINNAGDVVGFFVDGANTDGVLGTPVPEPTTWLMILAGFAGLGGLSLRSARKREAARAVA